MSNTPNALSVFGEIPFSDAASAITAPASEVPSFFPRIQLYGKGSAVDQGQIKPGHYGVPQEVSVIDLGAEIDVIPLAVLDKALDVSNSDQIVSVFGKTNPVYIEIANRSQEQDSGCMYGPVFLLLERSTGKFYEFFANNKSARREADRLLNFLPVNESAAKALGIDPRLPQAARLSAKYIKKPRYSWFAPVVAASTAQFTKLPTIDIVVKSVETFLKQALPKEDEAAADEPAAKGKGRKSKESAR
jgi:hypothetical protein